MTYKEMGGRGYPYFEKQYLHQPNQYPYSPRASFTSRTRFRR